LFRKEGLKKMEKLKKEEKMRKIILITIILIVPLLLGTTSSLLAGGPEPRPPGETKEQIVGPAIDGVLTVTEQELTDGWFSVSTFVGQCKKSSGDFPVYFEIVDPCTPGVFAPKTVDNIMYRRYEGYGPAGCFSVDGGDTLIITNVQKFSKKIIYNDNNEPIGGGIGAEISLMKIEPKLK
jgi:hypothetical protein